MKLLKNKRIQKLVDDRSSASLQPACVLCVPAAGEVDDYRGHVAHGKGVQDAMYLCSKFAKARQKLGRQNPRDFGIYVATQDTSDGKDTFYFIGTVESVCKRLERIESIDRIIAKPAQNFTLFVRCGDGDVYHGFDDMEGVANYIKECGVNGPMVMHVGSDGYGVEDEDGTHHGGHNFISLYWGEGKAQFHHVISGGDLRELNRELGWE